MLPLTAQLLITARDFYNIVIGHNVTLQWGQHCAELHINTWKTRIFTLANTSLVNEQLSCILSECEYKQIFRQQNQCESQSAFLICNLLTSLDNLNPTDPLHSQVNSPAYIYEIAEKTPQKQFEGNIMMNAVITLWELLTKCQTITSITYGSDKLPWLPTDSSACDSECR
jgi:hypothetical protein